MSRQATESYRSSREVDAQVHTRGPLGRRQDTLGVLGWKGPDRECTVKLHDWARNSVWNCGGSASSSCEPLPTLTSFRAPIFKVRDVPPCAMAAHMWRL